MTQKSDASPSRSRLTLAGETARVVPLLYSVEDAALAMGIGRTLLYELLAAGELVTVRVGRRVLVPVKALEAWIDAHSEGSLATSLATASAGMPRTRAISALASEFPDRSRAGAR